MMTAREQLRELVELLPEEAAADLLAQLVSRPTPIHDLALLSEAALAEDWLRPEEDEAWSHLQSAR